MEMNPTVSKDVNVIPTKYIKALDSYFVVVSLPSVYFPLVLVRPRQSLLLLLASSTHLIQTLRRCHQTRRKNLYIPQHSRGSIQFDSFSSFFLLFLLLRRPPFVANNDFILRILPRNRVSELYDWLTHVFVTLFNPAAATQKKREKKKIVAN
jgi:hypothetical protein